jgi:CRISPR-associated protein (TIGR02584 family)
MLLMNPQLPHSYARRILVTVAGVTPQLITETIYALITQDPAFTPTEVHVLTTEIGALLFFNQKAAYRTLFDLDYRQIFEKSGLALGRFYLQQDDVPIVASSQPGLINTYIHILTGPLGKAADVRTQEDNEQVAGFIMRAVLTLTRDDEAAVHASIAGGRRTMGFYLGYLMSMFGRQQDRLSHVLVDEHCANSPTFFYPPPSPTTFMTRDGVPFVSGPASVLLSNIPFVRHRSGFTDAELRHDGMTFSHAVHIAQCAVARCELSIDVASKEVTIGGQPVALKDNPLAWLLWFAEGRSKGDGVRTWNVSPAGFLKCYARVLNEPASLKWESTNDALKTVGFTPTDFRNRVSAVNRALQGAVGKVAAAPYLISAVGPKKQHEIRPYELTLPSSAIVIRS